MQNLFLILLLLLIFTACQNEPVAPPEPYGAVPSERHLAWYPMEYYAFVHFNINTFSDEEWGDGQENPEVFNPTALDTRQWVSIFKAAGMKGIIITAKHHDGFCLWPSEYTEHDVASSPWRNGEGDLLQELADACKEYDLKLGVYLSPWDRNNPKYGTPEYNQYFMDQLSEALTGYGDIFEVWFDGANGEGPNGKKQEYDWENFIGTVREHQPDAVIFSDAGPDIRWVGTEKGFANPTNWSTLNRDEYYPGTPRYVELRSGNQNGTHWVPAEVDVSIRPGWYYHTDEDSLIKSVDHLEQIYYESLGRNGNLLLNVPPDRRGLVHPNDSAALMDLKARLDATFMENLATQASVSASEIRGDDIQYNPQQLLDGDWLTYWAVDDSTMTASVELNWKEEKTFNVISLKEYIPLGQRIEAFEVATKVEGEWQRITAGTTIGYQRLFRFPAVTSDAVKVSITRSMACPMLSEIGLYFAPHDNKLIGLE